MEQGVFLAQIMSRGLPFLPCYLIQAMIGLVGTMVQGDVRC